MEKQAKRLAQEIEELAGKVPVRIGLSIGKRIFIQVLQQINGWRDLPKTLSGRTPTQ